VPASPAFQLDRPSVSVVIPCYACERTVGAAVESLRQQDFANWEAILIDDGSSDGTAAVLDRLAADDPRVRALRQPNAGVAAARNTGLTLARGRHVLFLDSDDWLLPGGLDALVAAAELRAESGRTAMVFGDWTMADVAGREFARHTARKPLLTHNDLLDSASLLLHCVLLPTDLAKAVRFDGSLKLIEDTDFWLRATAPCAQRPSGVSIHHCGAAVGGYRVTGASRSADFAGMLGWTGHVYRRAFEAAHARECDDGQRGCFDERLGLVMAKAKLSFALRAALVLGPQASDREIRAVIEPLLTDLATNIYPRTQLADAALLAHIAAGAVMMALATTLSTPGVIERVGPTVGRVLSVGADDAFGLIDPLVVEAASCALRTRASFVPPAQPASADRSSGSTITSLIAA